MNSFPPHRSRAGFTLFQILMIIAVIAILVVIAFPVFQAAPNLFH